MVSEISLRFLRGVSGVLDLHLVNPEEKVTADWHYVRVVVAN